MEYIALFFTHSGAVKYNKFLLQNGIKTEMMPVPRKLTSNCGIGVKFIYPTDISEFISEDIEKIYFIRNNEYKICYECE